MFKVSWDRYKYLSEEIRTELYVTHKTQSPYYHKYSMSTQNWLVFMDKDGIYREVEVSVGTYLTVNPPRNVTFYLSEDELNIIRKDYGFLKFSGGYYIPVILYIVCILILGCIFWARGDYKLVHNVECMKCRRIGTTALSTYTKLNRK